MDNRTACIVSALLPGNSGTSTIVVLKETLSVNQTLGLIRLPTTWSNKQADVGCTKLGTERVRSELFAQLRAPSR
jgi:hypothetical protein